MFRGRHNFEDDIFMSPKISNTEKSLQSRMLPVERVDKRPQRQPGNQYSFDGRHLQERNVPVPSGYSDLSSHGYSYSQARPASERVYQENVYPPKHSSSLNLSDTDKLYSGKYALDNSTNSGCGPGIMNFNQSNFNQRYTRSPVHNDWAHSFARTTSHCSLSPSRDGSVNALTKSNIRGASPGNHLRSVDTVKKIADDIIKEKDAIIESQRLRLEDLESHLKSTSHNFLPEEETLLRELERENQTLRKQLYNATHIHNSISLANSPAALEEQLCALEYKLSEQKKSSEKNLQLKDLKISDLTRELSEQKEEEGKCREKLRSRESELESAKKEVDRMMKYMLDLPTVEEHQSNIKKIEELEELLAKSEKVAQERSSNLKGAKKIIEAKDREMLKLKDEIGEVRKCLEQVQVENKSLNEEVMKSADLVDKRKMKETCEKLSRELDTLRKVYDAKVKQLQLKLSEEERENNSMKEMMMNEERTVHALRQDVAVYESNSESLRKRIKELTGESESLREELDKVKDERKFLQALRSERECRMFKQLMSDFSSAFEELQAIIKICKEKAENKEPNLDDLLGTKNLTNKINQEDMGSELTTEEMLQEKCQQLIELRRDIDFLRGELADLVAEDLGRRLTCSLQ